MNDYPGIDWLSRYRERVNADPELKVIGDWFTTDRKSTRLNSSHYGLSRMPSSA